MSTSLSHHRPLARVLTSIFHESGRLGQVHTMSMMFPNRSSFSNHVLIGTEFSHCSKYLREIINFWRALPRHIGSGRVIYSSSRSSTSHLLFEQELYESFSITESASHHSDRLSQLDAGGKPLTWFPQGKLVEHIHLKVMLPL